MIQIRGVLFNGIGHSVPRPVWSDDGVSKLRKRTELLPEEALYLIERGSLFCWRYKSGIDGILKREENINTQEEHFRMYGVPMTVQQAYAEMIGKDELTLEKYNVGFGTPLNLHLILFELQVYAHLKRLGFNVLRTHPPNDHYPTPPPLVHPDLPLFDRFKTFFTNLWKRLFQRINWWKPVRVGFLLGCAKNYR